MRLAGATVVVTGAASGIGRATALALGARGARPVLADRDVDGLAEAVDRCRSDGAHAVAVPTDVRDPDQVDALAERAAQAGLAAWVNNAGEGSLGPLTELPAEQIRAVVESDLLGALFGCRAALRAFRDRGAGVLVNVASVGGVVPLPLQAPYAAAKAGVLALGGALRQEVADVPGIQVSTVSPGPVRTPFWEAMPRWGTPPVRPVLPLVGPDDVARAVLAELEHPGHDRYVGWAARLVAAQQAVAPRVGEAVMGGVLGRLLVDRRAGRSGPPQELRTPAGVVEAARRLLGPRPGVPAGDGPASGRPGPG